MCNGGEVQKLNAAAAAAVCVSDNAQRLNAVCGSEVRGWISCGGGVVTYVVAWYNKDWMQRREVIAKLRG